MVVAIYIFLGFHVDSLSIEEQGPIRAAHGRIAGAKAVERIEAVAMMTLENNQGPASDYGTAGSSRLFRPAALWRRAQRTSV